jgi:hypothetical protein
MGLRRTPPWGSNVSETIETIEINELSKEIEMNES